MSLWNLSTVLALRRLPSAPEGLVRFFVLDRGAPALYITGA
ncbi:hypothetical protein [Phaeovulum sp.]